MARYRIRCKSEIIVYGAGGKGGSVEWTCDRNLNHGGKHKVNWITFPGGAGGKRRIVSLIWEDLQDTPSMA